LDRPEHHLARTSITGQGRAASSTVFDRQASCVVYAQTA
jgi:hypothetical protein